MKKVFFITQAKGGAGKSVLAFLLAEKYPTARIVDMDDATLTTMTQLAYRQPMPVTFLNRNKSIDRGLFNEFLEALTASENDHFICDLGASISEQLPQYFRDITPSALVEVLKAMNIRLEMICVVGGSNIFKASMTYLDDLVSAVGIHIPVTVALNAHYAPAPEQVTTLAQFTEANGITTTRWNISEDTNPSTQDRIREVLKSGKGIRNAPAFSKLYFQSAINNLTL